MKIEDIHQSKTVRGIIIGIGITIVVLLILFAGMNIGEHRARFANQLGDNFERNFMGPMNRGGGFWSGVMPGGHGVIGEIVSINLPQIVVSGQDNIEKIIAVGENTAIHQFQKDIQSSELKVGDFVVVLGNPNDQGIIDARLIRVMPSINEKIEK
ncbi:MAG: hypothetical protein V1896_00735 [Candidatus Zambryskibacteria bacterium]